MIIKLPNIIRIHIKGDNSIPSLSKNTIKPCIADLKNIDIAGIIFYCKYPLINLAIKILALSRYTV